jgi:hypothetical protein
MHSVVVLRKYSQVQSNLSQSQTQNSSNIFFITISFNYYVKIRNSKVCVVSETNTIDFSDNIDNLKSFIRDQVRFTFLLVVRLTRNLLTLQLDVEACQQQIKCIEHISTIFGWKVLTNGQVEKDQVQYSVLMLWNNALTKKIAIKLGPANDIQVYVNKYDSLIDKSGYGSTQASVNQTAGFETYLDMISAENYFDKIDLMNTYPGRTLINKFEFFMADIAHG